MARASPLRAADARRREVEAEANDLRAERNNGNRELGELMRNDRGEEADALKARMAPTTAWSSSTATAVGISASPGSHASCSSELTVRVSEPCSARERNRENPGPGRGSAKWQAGRGTREAEA